MAWLVSNGRVLASAEVLSTHRQRAQGLVGRDEPEGATVLRPCRWVHSIGMRYALDVAYLDRSGSVIKIARLRPHRVCAPVFAARTVVEASAGAFGRWGLHIGDIVEVRGDS